MSRPPRTVIEYRNYELPADFPIQMLSGENWRISDVPSGVLHFHNCLEIGLCESDGGFLGCNLVRRTEKGRLRRRGWGLRWEKAQKGGKGTNLRGFFED